MYTYLRQNWFKTTLWWTFVVMTLAAFLSAAYRTEVLAQQPTPASSSVLVTVTYSEQINVRNGPSTVLYEVIGHMQPGESAQALGVSPGRDWVQIVFPAAPDGIGWVHTSLISVSPGNLQIIEPPPTVTPRTTPTIDATLAAAYIFEPTVTRMPTFTPPPPLEIPTFTAAPVVKQARGIPVGALVVGSGVIGLLGYLLSLLRRR